MLPILWCLVVNSLLEALNSLSLFRIEHAYEDIIIVRGEFINSSSSFMTDRFNYAEVWCNTKSLSVSPEKNIIVAFTNKKILIVENIRFFNKVLI